jgi:predicted dinucleotide-binding enzyme
MRIGIIGAGNMGAALAAQLTRIGHQVAIANSADPGRSPASPPRPARPRSPSPKSPATQPS